MLSDEEKKAIEEIKSFNQYNWEMNNLKEREFAKPYFDALDTVLNLIEKQSKEIEELKEIYQTGYVNGCVSKVYEINKKWKDKIKAKIEELEKGNKNTFIRGEKILVLQSLLEKE